MADRVAAAATELCAAIDAACAPAATEAEMVAALRGYGAALDRLDAAGVALIAAMGRRGVFAEHGYHRPEYAVAALLGWDRRPARRRVALAERVCPRVAVGGEVLAPLLPATATVFAAGQISLAQAEAIAAVLDGPAARRLDPGVWAGAEEQIAGYAATSGATPVEVTGWARQLIAALDQDGAEPATEPEQPHELFLTRNPGGTGGRIRGRLDGPTFDALATAIDTLSKPRPEVHRDLPQRQADALGELAEFALRHDGALPDTGGERPQLRVTLGLEQLRAAVAGAILDTGAWYTPTQLRLLACDCAVIPAVLGSGGETAGHRPGHPGHPGRDPPGGHHPRPRLRVPRMRPTPRLVRCAPLRPLGRWRGHRGAQLRLVVPRASPHHPHHRLAGPHPRRVPRVHPTAVPRPHPNPPPTTGTPMLSGSTRFPRSRPVRRVALGGPAVRRP